MNNGYIYDKINITFLVIWSTYLKEVFYVNEVTDVKKKICLIIIIALMLLVPAMAAADNGPGYKDVKPGQWYYDDVMKLTSLGVVSGYPGGTFRPANKVTLAEFLRIFFTASGIDVEIPDAPEIHWAENYINEGFCYNLLNPAELGFVISDENTPVKGYKIFEYMDKTGTKKYVKMSKDDCDLPLTRLNAARIIARALINFKKAELTPGYVHYFNDVAQNDQEISLLCEKGIVVGTTDAKFEGDSIITRAEAVAIICRYLYGKKFTDKEIMAIIGWFTDGKVGYDPEIEVPGMNKMAKKSNVEGVLIGGERYYYNIFPHQSFDPVMMGKLQVKDIYIVGNTKTSFASVTVYTAG